MPKNAQTTAHLHSSHMLLKYCSKFSKPGFSNTWTVNFQMFKVVLEKAEEPEIKLPTYVGSSKKEEFQKNILFLLYWLCQSLWLYGSQQTVENSSSKAPEVCKPRTSRCPTGFRKGRGMRDQIANIRWIIEKSGEFQKDIYFCFIDYAKALTVWITINCGKF